MDAVNDVSALVKDNEEALADLAVMAEVGDLASLDPESAMSLCSRASVSPRVVGNAFGLDLDAVPPDMVRNHIFDLYRAQARELDDEIMMSRRAEDREAYETKIFNASERFVTDPVSARFSSQAELGDDTGYLLARDHFIFGD